MENAPTIYTSVTEFLKGFSDNIKIDFIWKNVSVGARFSYDETVMEGNAFVFHATVMELFIRKYLCTKYGIDIKDEYTETLLAWGHFKACNSEKYTHIQQCYDDYKNPTINAIDIIDKIKIIALSKGLGLGLPLYFPFYDKIVVKKSNLNEVMSYLDTLTFSNLICKERFDIQFNNYKMKGSPDYIFDNTVFCQIGTSMYRDTYKNKLNQVLFYIMGHYRQYYYDDNVTKNYTIIIYNPLLGMTNTTNVEFTPESYDKLKHFVEKCIEINPEPEEAGITNTTDVEFTQEPYDNLQNFLENGIEIKLEDD